MCFFNIKKIMLGLGLVAAAGIVILSSSSQNTFGNSKKELPIYSVEKKNDIALTFNCAWGNEDIDSILNSLSQYHCKATFFIVGEWAQKYPESVKKIVGAGHEIGTHSYKHDDYTKMTASEIGEDIAKADNAIFNACGQRPILVRLPSGAYDNESIRTCNELGKKCIQWSVDSIDYNKSTPDEIYSRVSQKVTDGSIILMHTGTESTALTLPRLLDSLTGTYKLSTVSELISCDKYTINNDGKLIPENNNGNEEIK